MTQSYFRSSPAEDGFTLIELLVSLSLLVIMLALINGSLRFGHRAWEVSDQVERTYSLAAFRNLLGQRLVETLPLVNWDDKGVPTSVFQGASGKLSFASPMSSRDGLPAGLFLVTLKLAPQAGAVPRPLSLEVQPLDGENVAIDRAGHAPVLIDNVARLAIGYFGSRERGGEPRWFDNWEGQTALPRLIAVDVQFPSGDPRTWPPLTRELKLGSRAQSRR
jgi:general secretion pathway protein J